MSDTASGGGYSIALDNSDITECGVSSITLSQVAPQLSWTVAMYVVASEAGAVPRTGSIPLGFQPSSNPDILFGNGAAVDWTVNYAAGTVFELAIFEDGMSSGEGFWMGALWFVSSYQG